MSVSSLFLKQKCENLKKIRLILGLQPRDKAAMLVVNTKEIFPLNLHQNRVHFPVERNAFVLDHQHGRRNVTCKPAIFFKYSSLRSNQFTTRDTYQQFWYTRLVSITKLDRYFTVFVNPKTFLGF